MATTTLLSAVTKRQVQFTCLLFIAVHLMMLPSVVLLVFFLLFSIFFPTGHAAAIHKNQSPK